MWIRLPDFLIDRTQNSQRPELAGFFYLFFYLEKKWKNGFETRVINTLYSVSLMPFIL